MKIKILVKDLEKDDILSKVGEQLRKDKENAYTVQGLMVRAFGVKEEEIQNKPFAAWKKGLPTLYSRIGRSLKRLQQGGNVKSKKHERAWVYWWVDLPNIRVREE